MSVFKTGMRNMIGLLTALWILAGLMPYAAAQEAEDPLYYRYGAAAAAATQTTFDAFTPRATHNETLRRGIDVSAWQGNIDWKAVAAEGVEFVIIRAAWKSSSSDTISVDSRFVQYINGAKAAGLKVGAYIYSQAITPQEAREEARFLMKTVAPYTIDLPLVLDFEYYSDAYGNAAGRLWDAELTRQEATDICNAFCDEVEKRGYESMVYSNPSMLAKHLYREQLGRLWLAHFISKTDYAGQYEYWQCCCSGKVNGISGSVDLDFWFQPGGTSVPRPLVTPAPTTTPTPGGGTAPEVSFSDVLRGSWYHDVVMQAHMSGVVKGVTATTFLPNATATRGQVITMIYRLRGEPAVTGSAPFTDLTEDYYKSAVTWAVRSGVAKGVTGTSFGPNYPITREQLVTMMYRLAGSPAAAGDLTKYADGSDVSAYAEDAMIWAVRTGVITGYSDGTLRPRASATRAEVCAILMRS